MISKHNTSGSPLLCTLLLYFNRHNKPFIQTRSLRQPHLSDPKYSQGLCCLPSLSFLLSPYLHSFFSRFISNFFSLSLWHSKFCFCLHYKKLLFKCIHLKVRIKSLYADGKDNHTKSEFLAKKKTDITLLENKMSALYTFSGKDVGKGA